MRKALVLCLSWLVLTGVGFSALVRYQMISGEGTQAPIHWPAAASTPLDSRKITCLLFVHPHCPCTRATLEELNRLLARVGERACVSVWFLKPKGFSSEWAQADLWRQASVIPGVQIHEDLEGAEARRFGVQTSGDLLLYNPTGHLLFQGGITGSRGHAGDNFGEDQVFNILSGSAGSARTGPVYGCSLIDPCPRSP